MKPVLTLMPKVAAMAIALGLLAGNALAAGVVEVPPRNTWSFSGPFGTFDNAQLQRGFKVYREVCASCHSMSKLAFRNLAQPGGPEFSEAQVKTLAASYQVKDGPNDAGEMFERPGRAADRIPSPFPNKQAAAAANGGAIPPDLSVITKARHGGAGYIYSLLMGYTPPPAGLTVAPGQHYNAYMPGDTSASWAGDPRHKPPGGFLAMAWPLEYAEVTFDDGTASTQEQMAHDVSVFLAWAGDPKAVARKQMGAAVIPYLLLLSLLVFLSYKRLWRNVEH